MDLELDLVEVAEDLEAIHNQFEKEEEDFLDAIAKKEQEYNDKLFEEEEASRQASIRASIQASIQESIQESIEESIRQENAKDLSCFADNTFDVTLLLGPMYHLFTVEDQKKALAEAIRVTKPGGVIFAAYCGNGGSQRVPICGADHAPCPKDLYFGSAFHCRAGKVFGILLKLYV